MTEDFIRRPDGDPRRPELFARWRPATTARGTVLVVHGFGEHSGRYEHVFAALVARGWSCLGIDLRGFGRAGGRRAFVRRYDDWLDDVQWGLDECRRRAPHAPVLFGHSQGGLVAAAFAALRARPGAVRGLALGSPALRFLMPVPAWKRVLAHLLSPFWPTLAIPAGIDPAILTHDEDWLRSLAEDPLAVRVATVRWYTECLRAQDHTLAAADRVTVPLLLLQAGDDRLVDRDAMRTFFDRCRAAAKTRRDYAGAFHELLNETPDVRTRVLADFAAWLDGLA